MTYRECLAALDHDFPPCGPCAFCGGPDKRHRLWDAIESSARVDGLEWAMRDYRASRGEVLRLVDAYARARRGHRIRPGGYPLVAA